MELSSKPTLDAVLRQVADVKGLRSIPSSGEGTLKASVVCTVLPMLLHVLAPRPEFPSTWDSTLTVGRGRQEHTRPGAVVHTLLIGVPPSQPDAARRTQGLAQTVPR